MLLLNLKAFRKMNVDIFVSEPIFKKDNRLPG